MPIPTIACSVAAFDNDQCSPDEGGIEAVAFVKISDLSSVTFASDVLTAVTVSNAETYTATQGDASTLTIEGAEAAMPTDLTKVTSKVVMQFLKVSADNLDALNKLSSCCGLVAFVKTRSAKIFMLGAQNDGSGSALTASRRVMRPYFSLNVGTVSTGGVGTLTFGCESNRAPHLVTASSVAALF